MTTPTQYDDHIETLARVVHEALRVWSALHGKMDIPGWNVAPDWMRVSTREAVAFRLKNPDADGSAQHDQWMEEKRTAGWRHGPVKDETAKTHPMMVPYDDLPPRERKKDALVGAIVNALKD